MIRLKFVDDTGTVEYNHDLQAIQVNFDGSGNFDQHMRTVQTAENMGKVYQTKSFLLIKLKYRELSPAEFKTFFSTWLSVLCAKSTDKSNDNYRISLITSEAYLLKLSEVLLEKSMLEYKNVVFSIFTSKSKASQFLKAEISKEKNYSGCLSHSI